MWGQLRPFSLKKFKKLSDVRGNYLIDVMRSVAPTLIKLIFHKKTLSNVRLSVFILNYARDGLNRLSLNAFARTETELRLIAAPAIIGLNKGPPKMWKMPIANGIPNTL